MDARYVHLSCCSCVAKLINRVQRNYENVDKPKHYQDIFEQIIHCTVLRCTYGLMASVLVAFSVSSSFGSSNLLPSVFVT
jgi:hypothetical protein